MLKLLCWIKHSWKTEFNYKYPRFDMFGFIQNRYIRTCKRCEREELSRMDMIGTWYWTTIDLNNINSILREQKRKDIRWES